MPLILNLNLGLAPRNSQFQYTGESSCWNEAGDYKERGGDSIGILRWLKLRVGLSWEVAEVRRWLKGGG